MHTEESILTEMRRLGFVLTPLLNVGYHFEYGKHDLFICPDTAQNNILKIILPISTEVKINDDMEAYRLVNETNNIMNLTTASIVDDDTIWVSYRTFLSGNEPLGVLLDIAINAVTSTADHIQNGLKSIL
jgi:hypothetical protein